jgi:hypothetical protein
MRDKKINTVILVPFFLLLIVSGASLHSQKDISSPDPEKIYPGSGSRG